MAPRGQGTGREQGLELAAPSTGETDLANPGTVLELMFFPTEEKVYRGVSAGTGGPALNP